MGQSRPLFLIFFFSIQLTVNIQFNFLLMTGFEPRTSGVGSDCSTNWATTTAQDVLSFYYIWHCIKKRTNINKKGSCLVHISKMDQISHCLIWLSHFHEWINSVWPDLAKFRHFGNILWALGEFTKVYLVLELTFAIFYTIGQIVIDLKGPMLNK